jgi:hypothetical protein
MAHPQVADGGEAPQIWRVAANILNKQSRTADKGWSSSLGIGRGAINFVFEYDIRKVQEKQVSLKLNGTHQLLVCADDTNLLGNCINTIKENTETLLKASRDVGLEINAEKTKYIIMSCHPNSGQNQNIRTANELFENVAQFKYLGTTLINYNDTHDKNKSRLNSGNACYHSV